ncbi:MAG: putative phosphoribosyl transferase [Anaerolineales bacterium]|nr:putative phosphoribosyl transferase [Anaerolineales bacterium]
MGERLQALGPGDDVLVLALPRGGVPVGYEVAQALDASLDVFVTRKIGAPGNPEFAIGAVASDGTLVLDEEVITELAVSGDYVDAETQRQLDEVERRVAVYRGDRPRPQTQGRTVILVDDGVATGSTVRASLRALRASDPGRLILAVPVGPPRTIQELRALADEVVALSTPEPFWAIGRFYEVFGQTRDEEVVKLLEAAGQDT